MKHSILKQGFLAASLAVTAAVGGQSLANAAPGTSTINQTAAPESVISEAGQSPIAEVTPATQSASPSPTTEVTTPAAPVTPTTAPVSPVTAEPVTTPAVPLPGTVPTSASPLQSQTTDQAPTPAMEQTAPTEAQPAPEQRFTTRYKFSYIGIGSNFGVGGGTALGNVSFSAFSKFALTPEFSFRPGIMVEKTVTFLLPATYDFRISGPGQIAPFAGIGAKINTGDSDQFDLLLTGGVDYPINKDLVANATLNIGPLNGFDAGIAIGLAYSFGQETIRTPEGLGGIGNEVGNLFGKNPAKPNPGYLGAGMNFGTGGGGALGRISGAVYGKLPVSSYFSVRPAMMFTNQFSFLLPVTYDFNQIRITENIRLFPYAGTGVSFNSDKNNVGWLLSAGVDMPITSNFVGTLGVNVNPLDTFSIGFLLGVAYSFGQF
ncbi:MAG: hypothetical protein ACKO24_10285 [Leptolyngbyaceae cyanobacterium]